MELWVDETSQGVLFGSTSMLKSSNDIDIGRLATETNSFTGHIRDVKLYDYYLDLGGI